MQIHDWIILGQLIVTFLGVVLIGLTQLSISKQIAERDAFVNLLNGILELKKWAVTQPLLMQGVRAHKFTKQLMEKGVVKDEQELMTRCTFFFHAEKLYHLSKRAGIQKELRENLEREVSMWVLLEGMEEFFVSFCERSQAYSKDFLAAVRKVYETKAL